MVWGHFEFLRAGWWTNSGKIFLYFFIISHIPSYNIYICVAYILDTRPSPIHVIWFIFILQITSVKIDSCGVLTSLTDDRFRTRFTALQSRYVRICREWPRFFTRSNHCLFWNIIGQWYPFSSGRFRGQCELSTWKQRGTGGGRAIGFYKSPHFFKETVVGVCGDDIKSTEKNNNNLMQKG